MAGLEQDTPIGEVLLDQRIANGVGNVYKSEVCWHERLDPFTPVGEVPRELRRRLIVTSGRLLQGEPRPRSTPDRRRGARRLRPSRSELSAVWRADREPDLGWVWPG